MLSTYPDARKRLGAHEGGASTGLHKSPSLSNGETYIFQSQKSLIQGRARYALTSGDLFNGHHPAPPRLVRAPIVCLLLSRSPSAIIGFVVSAWVTSIERLIFGALTHVGKKILKAVEPSITHSYSGTAISRKRLVVRVLAPFFSCLPRLISLAFGQAMRPRSITKLLAVQASATLRVARLQGVASHRSLGAAIAFAHPINSIAARRWWLAHIALQYGHPSVAKTNAIYELSQGFT